MKLLTIISFVVSASFAAVTYRIENDCYKDTRKEIPVVLPDGRVEKGITCTIVPHVVVDTVKADTTKAK